MGILPNRPNASVQSEHVARAELVHELVEPGSELNGGGGGGGGGLAGF